jgi:signal transduction histidine kinase
MLLYAAATVAYALVPALWAGPVWIVWGAGSLLIMLRALARLVGTAFETRRAGWAVAAVVFALWLGGFSLSLVGSTDADRLMVGIAVVGVGGFLWSRTGTALRDSIALNRLLEERVAAREAELAANYARVRELEHARVVAGERERLTRDMHDGTGGLLVAALALARRQSDRSGEGKELTRLLEDAVEDLRLALASLRPQQGDLPSVLGLLRERLGRQARHHEMSLEWGVSDAGEGRPLDGERSLQVIRVVQEAVTNALRHSGGTRVAVATRSTENGAIAIDVRDDGHGGIAAADAGRGIAHMRARAARLGARLDVDSGPGGTRVALVLDPPSGD